MKLTVNGREHELDVEPRTSLADALRDHLGLTGTHLGCEQGVCGACAVLVDGEPQRACLLLAVQAEGTPVTTVEGLAQDPELARVPRAFLRHRGFQCGFCTPGFEVLVAGMALAGGRWDGDELRAGLASHICRCTGYESILAAAREVLG